MNAAMPEASPITENEAEAHRAGGARAAVDIWLDANIKALDAAEHRRYRSYLVPSSFRKDVVGAKD